MENTTEKVIENVAKGKRGSHEPTIETYALITVVSVMMASTAIGYIWGHRRGFKLGRRITKNDDIE
jgi:hypothetical protein